MKPQSLNRKPQKTMNSYSWAKILFIGLLITIFIYWIISSMYAPYYGNYLIGGV